MRLVGPLPDFLTRCIARFREERCAQAAASLAFTTLLALVPLITVALVLISQFDLFSGLGAALRNFLLANLLCKSSACVNQPKQFIINCINLITQLYKLFRHQ